MEIVPPFLALVTLAAWVYLIAARGGFWRVEEFDADSDPATAASWPAVTAVVPARNEAPNVGQTLAALLAQDYPGAFSIVLVDDHSEDGTAEIARRAAEKRGATARVMIRTGAEIPPGWTGKVWAMAQGVYRTAAAPPDYFWFTDADVLHAPDTLRRLVARAERDRLDLASLMVLLESGTIAERALIPAFLYFFLKLYPPRWIAAPAARTAGAAGGCALARREALQRVGGLATIRGEVIDDCALARALKFHPDPSGRGKNHTGRIWMGLTRKSRSLRAHAGFVEIQDLIARTAFTQLRYSVPLLLATLAGMFVVYLAPIVLLFVPSAFVRALAFGALVLMTLSFLPTVRFYRISLLWALALPFAALFYSYATWLSALRYWLGGGGQWKGRYQAPRAV